jgi:hypothetical protein
MKKKAEKETQFSFPVTKYLKERIGQEARRAGMTNPEFAKHVLTKYVCEANAERLPDNRVYLWDILKAISEKANYYKGLSRRCDGLPESVEYIDIVLATLRGVQEMLINKYKEQAQV